VRDELVDHGAQLRVRHRVLDLRQLRDVRVRQLGAPEQLVLLDECRAFRRCPVQEWVDRDAPQVRAHRPLLRGQEDDIVDRLELSEQGQLGSKRLLQAEVDAVLSALDHHLRDERDHRVLRGLDAPGGHDVQCSQQTVHAQNAAQIGV